MSPSTLGVIILIVVLAVAETSPRFRKIKTRLREETKTSIQVK